MKSEYKHPLLKTIADFVLHYGGLSPHNQSTFDPVVIRCCGEDATFRVVSTVISPISLFHIQYVRVVAMMYGRVWAKRYEGQSRRIMLDPAFAQLVLIGSHDYESVCASDVIQRTVARIQDKDRIPTYSVNMVFVPVYEGGRWWCLIFSFNRAEIVVVDAAFSKRASEVHDLSVGKLIHAMDLVLQQADQTWQTGLLWGYETGVVMLEVVKECSDRLLQSTMLVDLQNKRLRLLCDDITCEFNEVKHETEAFLNRWRLGVRGIKGIDQKVEQSMEELTE
ncbi:putative 39.7 kDa protein in nrdC-mobD intergenic region [Bienertia sinuspersici]